MESELQTLNRLDTNHSENEYPLNAITSTKQKPTDILAVRNIPDKGRGLVSLDFVTAGTLIEVAPTAKFHGNERSIIDQTSVSVYYFVRPNEYQHSKNVDGYLVFGLVSLCNHSDTPNVRIEWVENETGLWSHLITTQDIQAGEEVTMYYTNIDEYSFNPQ
ncbi:MAG: SET domain-containing protein-lysine N-methyltransferase [bacterium]